MRRLSHPCKSAALACACMLLSGCLTTPSTPAASGTGTTAGRAPKIEPCEAIASLTASYTNQFADIRRAKRSYNRIDIWSTPYQIVGNNCEIWGWQGGHYNYVCHYVAPDENSAREIYGKARDTIRQCLSPDWTLREDVLGQPSASAQTEGSQAVFRKQDFSGVIDLRLIQARGINTPRWAVYVMIGDYNSNL